MKASTLTALAIAAGLAISSVGVVVTVQMGAAHAEDGTTLITLGTAGGPLPR
jgi:hypothetical protein